MARAAAADGRAIAYVLRRTAELMADDYRKHGGYVRFVSLAAFPYVDHPRRPRDGVAADRRLVVDARDRRWLHRR